MASPKKIIASFSARLVGPDFGVLSKGARRFLDEGDVRYEATLTLSDLGDETNFVLGFLIMGLTDQRKVKCLIPSSIQYLSHSPGKEPPVHGHCLSIRDGIVSLPINQSLEVGTKFQLSVSNAEPIKIEPGDIPPMHAITVLTDRLKPMSKLSVKPFNNRCYLLHVLPGETLDAVYTVGHTNQFSLHEATYFMRPSSNVLVFGTCLGRSPSDLLRLIAKQLRERMEEKVANIYLKNLRAAGYTDDDRGRMDKILYRLFDEIEVLK